MVVVHMADDPGSRRGDGVGLGLRVVVGLDPAHSAKSADVSNGLHIQTPPAEVRKVDVVEGAGVAQEECFPNRIVRRFPSEIANQGHPGEGEGIDAVGRLIAHQD